MAKYFRLACAVDNYLSNEDKTKRPEKPPWLRVKVNSTRLGRVSRRYWIKIYWATPPWITAEQIKEMRRIYLCCPIGYHVDHIVPLVGGIVCGLHVPWNLQYLPDKCNLVKSNHIWPGHPCENNELFGDYEPQQLRLFL